MKAYPTKEGVLIAQNEICEVIRRSESKWQLSSGSTYEWFCVDDLRIVKE